VREVSSSCVNVFPNIRYAISQVRANGTDAYWRQYRFSENILRPIHQNIIGDSDGEVVREQDWDSLIILDACRADLFEEFIDLNQFDNYRRSTSLASKTDEWTLKNWVERGATAPGENGDVVYTSGNPVISKVASKSFHYLDEPWSANSVYDDDLHAIRPEPISDSARRNIEEYPHKRHIIHYVQPHMPLIAEPDMIYRTWWEPGSESPANKKSKTRHIWAAFANNYETEEDVWHAYGRTLKLVFDEAIELAHDLPGRTVIASDHGNLLGERPSVKPPSIPTPVKMYGHPGGLRFPELIEVPWAIVDSGDRPVIQDDGINSGSEVGGDLVERRLADLGYI